MTPYTPSSRVRGTNVDASLYGYTPYGEKVVLNPQRGWVYLGQGRARAFVALRKAEIKRARGLP